MRWRETFYYLQLGGPDAMPIVFLVSFLLGVVLAFEAAMRVAERALALGARRTAATAMRTAERAAGADAERLGLLEVLRRRASTAGVDTT